MLATRAGPSRYMSQDGNKSQGARHVQELLAGGCQGLEGGSRYVCTGPAGLPGVQRGLLSPRLS